MRQAVLEMVYELAKKDNRVFYIGSDLGAGTLDQFKKEMPDRFFMEGISEQSLIGMATGLALEGKIVYVNTLAVFITRRCFEQNVLDLGLHNANVRLIGNGGGLVYAPLGPTHEAIDDIAIMKTIPNMAILVPADAAEMRKLMALTLDHRGPIYIRVAKGNDPIVTKDLPVKIGKAVVMREGNDALVITTGITLNTALEAAEELSKEGVEAAVLHLHTVKPLDAETILKYCDRAPVVVTIEEHSIIGGIGSSVAELIAEKNYERGKKFKRIALPNVFPEGYGSQAELMEKYSITKGSLVSTIKDLMSERR